MRTVRLGAAVLLASATAVLIAPSAHAATIRVNAGQSIQAAVDAAAPGDTILIGPGIFHEIVTVTKSNLTIVGSGTVIEPPAGPVPYGLCVSATTNCANTNVIPLVSNVVIKGITVAHEDPAQGFVSEGATKITFANDVATDDGLGFSIGNVSNEIFSGDTAEDDLVGMDVAAVSNSTISGSTFQDNSWGIVMGQSNGVTVSASHLQHNCAGLVVTVASGLQAPITVTGNVFAQNNSTCGGNSFIPPTDGVGALVDGSSNVHMTGNAFQANGQPNDPATWIGGLVVQPTYTGTGNVFSGNTFASNVPLDIRTDSTDPAKNLFIANTCQVSDPAGLCH